jgi:glycosyltransferase involved in cell wall biosynthesis
MNFFNYLVTIGKLWKYRCDVIIAIPASYYNGQGPRYLADLLDSVARQKDINFLVLVTDHSNSKDLAKVVEDSDIADRVFYIPFPIKRGRWPSNANFGIFLASLTMAPYVKIMFQDDVFCDDFALRKILNSLAGSSNWACHSSSHFEDPKKSLALSSGNYDSVRISDRVVTPRFSDRLLVMENHISCPTAVTFPNNSGVYFDKKLILGGDCEFYYHLYRHLGPPIILSDVLTSNREHSVSVTSNLMHDVKFLNRRFRNGRKVLNRKDLIVWESTYSTRKWRVELLVDPIGFQDLLPNLFRSARRRIAALK